MGPGVAMITPEPARADDVPLNTRVRAFVPLAGMGRGGRLVLRRQGSIDEVPARTEATRQASRSLVELTPSRPLDAGAAYEVAVVDPSRFPSTVVFSTFRTGTATDTTAPRLDSGGTAKVERSAGGVLTSCSVPGPWVTIRGVAASDPGRARAQLAIAVWLGDAAGRVDDTRPPTTVERYLPGDAVTLGARGVCDPRTFPVPPSGPMWIGLAALAEAGKRSAVRRMRIDLGTALP